MPGAPRWQITDSISYAPVGMPLAPSFGISYRYLSRAPGELAPNPQIQGGYNLFDLRAGVTIGPVGIAAFVENAGNVRGISQATTGIRGPQQFLVRPRMIGLTLDYKL
ncbi:TonB-dependent receptor [Sphingomonas sp.]|uniref:TonB-dependent receptor n=1 Tax=Sphingomonas sp. TaxID=28214 RepID=UPI00345912F7